MKQKPPAVWEAFSVGRNARHDGFPWRKAIMRHACMRALQAECDAVIDRKRTILRRERRPRRSAKRYQNQPYNPSVTASPCHLPLQGRHGVLAQWNPRCPLDTRVLPCRVGRRFCLRQRCPPDTRALAGEAKTPPACLAATHLPLQGRQAAFCRSKNKRVARSAIRLFCCMGL